MQVFDEDLQFSLEQATDSATMMKSMHTYICFASIYSHSWGNAGISSVLSDVTASDRGDLRLELENFLKVSNWISP